MNYDNSRRILLLAILLLSLLLLTLSSCSGELTEDDIFFPNRSKPADVMLTEQLKGNLVLENGYMVIRHRVFFWIKVYPVWPYGYTFELSGTNVEVYDENRKVVAKTGKTLNGGGGSTTAEWASEKLTNVPLPPDYQSDGKVFMIGVLEPLD